MGKRAQRIALTLGCLAVVFLPSSGGAAAVEVARVAVRALQWALQQQAQNAMAEGHRLQIADRPEEAAAQFERARDLYRKLGQESTLWVVESSLASLYAELGVPGPVIDREIVREFAKASFYLSGQPPPPDGDPIFEDELPLVRKLLQVAGDQVAFDGQELQDVAELLDLWRRPQLAGDELARLEQLSDRLLECCRIDPELCAVVRIRARVRRSEAYREAGDHPSAELELQRAQGEAQAIGSRDIAGALSAFQGHLSYDSGEPKAGIERLNRALAQHELTAGQIFSDALKVGYLGGEYARAYQGLLYMQLEQRRMEDAFATTERLRSRALHALVQRSGEPGVDSPAVLAELAHHQQTLRETREALERASPGEREALLRHLGELEQQWEALLIRRAALRTRNGPSEVQPLPQEVSLDALKAEIPPGTTLVSFFDSLFGLHVWVLNCELFAFRVLPFDDLDQKRLQQLWDGLTQGAAASRGGEAWPSRDATLHQASTHLYRRLIEPIRTELRGRKLILVPHGRLHSLPFAALEDPSTGRSLIEDFALSQVPSASVLIALRRRETPVRGASLVLGAPATPAGLTPLPGAAAEARAVAGQLGTIAWLGAEATEGRFGDAGSADLVHIAAHGFFDLEHPSLSHLALAPSPGHDGRLERHEIAASLAGGETNLVVLSACETGRGRRTGGDEILGLTRAFLEAGVPGVVSTLWRVDDAATARLMADFYRYLVAGDAPADALRFAQIARRRDPLTAHPALWAGFVLTGDPQGRWQAPPAQVELDELQQLLLAEDLAALEPRLDLFLHQRRAAGDDARQAVGLALRGMVRLRWPDPAAAEADFGAAVERAEASGNRAALWWVWWVQGASFLGVERSAESLEPLRRALAVAEELEQNPAQVQWDVLPSLGALDTEFEGQDAQKALMRWGLSAVFSALSRERLGVALLELGDLGQAEQQLRQAGRLPAVLGHAVGFSLELSLGRLRLQQGLWTEARAHFERSLRAPRGAYRELSFLESPTPRLGARGYLAELEVRIGRPEAALRWLDEEVAERQKRRNRWAEASALQARARFQMERGQWLLADADLQRALGLARERDLPIRHAAVQADLDRLTATRALTTLRRALSLF